MSEHTVICVGCPLGCHITADVNDSGQVANIRGNQCPKGVDYAMAELTHPERVLTATVLTEGAGRPLLPVKTDKAVGRDQLSPIMCSLTPIRVKPPVKMGQEIVHNIAGTGANLISTGTL
jgi:CxxC motif-containing protein